MLDFISSNLANILVGAAVLIAFALAIRSQLKSKGSCSCGGDCANCGACKGGGEASSCCGECQSEIKIKRLDESPAHPNNF